MRVALIVACLLLAATTVAQAQVLDPEIRIVPASAEVEVHWNGSMEVAWRIHNDGPLELEITAQLEHDPDWQTDFASQYLGPYTVASGDFVQLVIQITPVGGLTTTPEPTFLLRATGTDVLGRTDSATATVEATFVAEPPPLPPDRTPLYIAVAIGLLLTTLLVGYLLYRRSANSFHLAVFPPVVALRPGPGVGVHHQVSLENRGRRSRTIQVQVSGRPADWKLSLSRNEIQLDPGESGSLSLYLEPASDAAPHKTHLITVTARNGRHRPWTRSQHVGVSVLDDERPAP